MPSIRKVLIVLALVFIVYAVLNEPQQSAGVVHSAFVKVVEGVSAIGQFLNALIRG